MVVCRMAEAIDIAARFEDVVFNGTIAEQVVTVHSDNAVGSSITLGQRSLIAISPDAINQWGGIEAPPVSQVDVSFESSSDGSQTQLQDLRNATAAPIKCAGGKCRMTLALDATAVFMFSA
jgi:hypothetical protein